jgi:hypothetical protein
MGMIETMAIGFWAAGAVVVAVLGVVLAYFGFTTTE